MDIMLSRGRIRFLIVLLLVGAFVAYTRYNPNWKEPIRRVMKTVYLTTGD